MRRDGRTVPILITEIESQEGYITQLRKVSANTLRKAGVPYSPPYRPRYSLAVRPWSLRLARRPPGFGAHPIFAAVSMKTRLRMLRAEMEWTQADLAQRLGVSRQTINAIETGKYDSSLPLAIRIARLFSKAVEEIFLLDGEPPRNTRSGR
jgi:putative transcriptional regulator